MGSSITTMPFSPFPPSFKKPANSISTNTTTFIKPIPQRSHISCFTIGHHPTSTVSQKVQVLDVEFKSLPEPIDRVKRLLQYASILPPFDESSRIQENRVSGCTTQVWLEVRMDGNGVMRFRVDSDSEITKGFCSCLIWLLDGAAAAEVLSVGTHDLVGMNVGLPSKAASRVNTWHNVLISMQRRTRDLVEQRERDENNSLCSTLLD